HTDGTAGEGLFRMDNGGGITDLTLSGVVFDGQGIAGVHGILGQGLIGTVTVDGCTLENIANWAVFDSDSGGGIGDDGLTGFVFTNNTVRDNDGAIALRGAPLAAAVPTTSTVVSGNSFTNMNTSLHAGPCSYPANQCGWAGVEVTRVTTATVTNNTFDNLQLGSFGEGEGLQAWMITTLTVTGNTFNNCDSGIEIAFMDTNPVNATITGNTITNMATRGIGIWDSGAFLSGASSTAGVDASCNYWGSDDGPLVAGENDATANGEVYGPSVVGEAVYALWRITDVNGACTGGDCDGDSVFDGDQIAAGAADCNSNQVLDSCETCDTDVYVGFAAADGVDNF
ncbi:MAG: right-handed parallel beta-helix repeat-containing protein, partial [Planctomycetota bacterium]